MPPYTARPMCSTNEPKSWGLTSPRVNPGWTRTWTSRTCGTPGTWGDEGVCWSLEAAEREAALPVLLHGEEGDDQGDDRHQGAADDQGPQTGPAARVGGREAHPLAETHGDGEALVAGQHGQRQEVVVPVGHDGQQQHRDRRRPHQRQRDEQERADLAGPVDPGG